MAAGHRSILIVGAGPTGLTAALELARRGIRSRIIDSDTGPVPVAESRALGINARTLTLLSPSRVTERILQEGRQIARFRVVSGGRRLFEIDTTRVPGRYGAVHALAQGHTERLLIGALPDYEIEPEWRTTLETLSGDLSRSQAVLRRPDGSAETADFDIVVGADGRIPPCGRRQGSDFPESRWRTASISSISATTGRSIRISRKSSSPIPA